MFLFSPSMTSQGKEYQSDKLPYLQSGFVKQIWLGLNESARWAILTDWVPLTHRNTWSLCCGTAVA